MIVRGAYEAEEAFDWVLAQHPCALEVITYGCKPLVPGGPELRQGCQRHFGTHSAALGGDVWAHHTAVRDGTIGTEVEVVPDHRIIPVDVVVKAKGGGGQLGAALRSRHDSILDFILFLPHFDLWKSYGSRSSY